MATAKGLSCDKERTNYLRLCRGLIDLGSRVLRDILKQNILPADIKNAIKSSNIKLNSGQRQQLGTVMQGADAYSQLDISLLYCLIRGLCSNIKPTKGWNPPYPPSPTENTVGDDIERIRCIRNFIYGHIAETRVSDKIFEEYWDELDNVMARMDVIFGSQYRKLLLTMEIDSMDLVTIKREHLKG